MKQFAFFSLAFNLIFCFTSPAQQIYNSEQPEPQLLWTRLADYSPKLRSVEAIEISPDGRHTKYTGFAKLIDLESGKVQMEYGGEHPASVKSVRMTADEKLIASGSFANEDSGLIQLYLFLSNTQQRGNYHQLSNEQLDNKDLKK
jgi:hypothetical protein